LSLVVLRARDLEQTLAFYRALGLSFVREQHGSGPVHYSSQLGPTVLEIYPGKAETEPDRRAPGATMIGLAVDGFDDALAAARARGSKILSEPKGNGIPRRAVVEDPDGRALELTPSPIT